MPPFGGAFPRTCDLLIMSMQLLTTWPIQCACCKPTGSQPPTCPVHPSGCHPLAYVKPHLPSTTSGSWAQTAILQHMCADQVGFPSVHTSLSWVPVVRHIVQTSVKNEAGNEQLLPIVGIPYYGWVLHLALQSVQRTLHGMNCNLLHCDTCRLYFNT